MEKTLRKSISPDEERAGTVVTAYWQSRTPASERFAETWQLSRDRSTQKYRQRGIPEYRRRIMRDLLLAFNAHNVRYLVVIGYALRNQYCEPRATKDLDVFIDPNPENAVLVFEALARFGAALSGMTPKDFHDGKSWFQVGVALSRIDVIQRIGADRLP